MNERIVYLLAALIGGAFIPIQVALNTLLRRYVGDPMQVTFVSYLVGDCPILSSESVPVPLQDAIAEVLVSCLL